MYEKSNVNVFIFREIDHYYLSNFQMSWADLELAYALDFTAMLGLTFNLDEAPKLRAIKEMVYSHPKITAWIAKRPRNN